MERERGFGVLGAFAVAFLATADLPTRVTLFEQSGTAYLVGGLAYFLVIVAAGLLAVRLRLDLSTQAGVLRSGRTVPIVMWWLLAWGAISLILHGAPAGEETVQTILCLWLFVVGMWYVAHTTTSRGIVQTERWYPRAGWMLALFYGISLVVYGFGSDEFIGRRSFGMVAALLIAWLAGQWTHLRPVHRLLSFILLAETALSGSRTATAIAFVVFAAASLSKTAKTGQLIFRVVAGIAAFAAAVLYYQPLQDRFSTGDLSLVAFGIPINVEGRVVLWAGLLRYGEVAPWTGQGLGASQAIVRDLTSGRINQPHNEFLRLWVDLGYIGLGLVLLGLITLAARIWWLVRIDTDHRPTHASALLMLAALIAFFATDNPLVYIFAIIPTAVTVGQSLSFGRGLGYPTRSSATGGPRPASGTAARGARTPSSRR
ncbi:O-antigen ligase family protein [Quadrisphaera sp. GCM10027208]|uniref:O-antigen ligase family protein n=1 Tax=Quadrisphaera sp. GCM10027208 TaxID=3273423 RepID=UPI00361ABBD9